MSLQQDAKDSASIALAEEEANRQKLFEKERAKKEKAEHEQRKKDLDAWKVCRSFESNEL